MYMSGMWGLPQTMIVVQITRRIPQARSQCHAAPILVGQSTTTTPPVQRICLSHRPRHVCLCGGHSRRAVHPALPVPYLPKPFHPAREPQTPCSASHTVAGQGLVLVRAVRCDLLPERPMHASHEEETSGPCRDTVAKAVPPQLGPQPGMVREEGVARGGVGPGLVHSSQTEPSVPGALGYRDAPRRGWFQLASWAGRWTTIQARRQTPRFA